METYHSCGWVDDLHLFEDCGAIIRDKNFALGGLDLIDRRKKIELVELSV